MKERENSCLAEPSPPARGRWAAPPQRILVVDDDMDVRRLSAEALIGFGYEVDAAEDGEAAWEALHAKSYDLLITDNKMPKISGMELIEKLRSAQMALPVILSSGAMPVEALDRHSPLQLAALLLKPFTREDLLGAVKKVFLATRSSCEQIAPQTNCRIQPAKSGSRLW